MIRVGMKVLMNDTGAALPMRASQLVKAIGALALLVAPISRHQ